jgi:hypothetical protein
VGLTLGLKIGDTIMIEKTEEKLKLEKVIKIKILSDLNLLPLRWQRTC